MGGREVSTLDWTSLVDVFCTCYLLKHDIENSCLIRTNLVFELVTIEEKNDTGSNGQGDEGIEGETSKIT